MRTLRPALWFCCLGPWLAGVALLAQGKPDGADHKRGTPPAPTHDPRPHLPPATAMAHLQQGHAAWLSHRRQGQPPPAAAERPAGAGRYVCAVLHCAEIDLDLPTALGLARRDVLLLSLPGPFVTPEVTAMLQRLQRDERLSLILIVGHDACQALQPPADTNRKDALSRRAEHAATEAARSQRPLLPTMLDMQRQLLLAGSEPLRAAVAADTLRVVVAELTPRTQELRWRVPASHALPMPPVR